MTKTSVVVLISGSGSNLQAIIDYSLSKDCHYQITAVISNRADAYGLQRAAQHAIPTHVVAHQDYNNREDFDRQLSHIIDDYRPGLVVLAGFMRILTPFFVQHYCGRLLNIHPSLLPKYQGLHTHKRALAAGDQQHGVSIHFVTEELDGGPVILQSRIDIDKDDTVESLQQKIHAREHIIYPICVDWFCQGKVNLDQGRALYNNQHLEKPLIYEDLSIE